MRSLAIIFLWYPLFEVPVVIGIGSAWLLFRSGFRFGIWEVALVTAPWLLWLGLSAVNSRSKSLANAVEAIALGVFTGIIFAFQSSFGLTWPSYAATVAARISAACLWAFVPGLPE